MSTKSLTPRRRGVTSIAAAVSVAVPASLLLAAVGQTATAAPLPQPPNTAVLAGALAKQTITWEACNFGDPRFDKPNVNCATVKVPRDWKNPQNGLTWDIRISHAKNQDVKSGRYKGTIFANPGGPGGSGLIWGPAMQERTPDLNPYYNYVGFDPRGVGQSSRVTCHFEFDKNDSKYAFLIAQAQTCSNDPDVKTITTEQTAYDMDFIRHLLKAPKLSYVGYSYGTWLGAWYEKIFGVKYGDKFVLDSAIDATQPSLESTWNLQPVARDRQFRMHMMNWIARHNDGYNLGTDPKAIYDRYFAATANLDPSITFIYWLYTGAAGAFAQNQFYPLAAETVGLLIAIGESEEGAKIAKEQNPAKAVDALLAKQEAKATGADKKRLKDARAKLAPLTKISTLEQQRAAARSGGNGTDIVQWETSDIFDMIRCNDGQWTQGSAYWERKNAEIAKKAPLTDSWGLISMPVCAWWRTQNLMPVANAGTFPKTIVVQGELDSQTGWEGGYAAGVKLPNTSFIAIDNEGSHGHFPYGTEDVDRPIYDFFLKGKVAPNITVTQALPLIEETETYESWAKLNNQAKHVPGIAGPGTPTGIAAKKIAADKTGDDLLAKIETSATLRQQILKIYGEAGVKALEKSGAL